MESSDRWRRALGLVICSCHHDSSNDDGDPTTAFQSATEVLGLRTDPLVDSEFESLRLVGELRERQAKLRRWI